MSVSSLMMISFVLNEKLLIIFHSFPFPFLFFSFSFPFHFYFHFHFHSYFMILFPCFRSRFKVVLTGTPIQNNMGEMYCLLHYLAPKVFDDPNVFSDCFSLVQDNIKVDRKTLVNAHYMLRIFILRRLKVEVEFSLPSKLETLIRCPMSEMQKFWTKRLLMREQALMEAMDSKEKSKNAI